MTDHWDQGKGLLGTLGTDRFTIERRLGEGSMGAVYLAYDTQRRARVALKTLRRVDALGIYRFKREFRALADLSHPNLVALHELFSQGDQWFFTMEYIEGKDYLSYVLGDAPRDLTRTPQSLQPEDAPEGEPTEPRVLGLELLFPSPLREPALLRAVLVQIVEGLRAVHAAGKLHRDLKSENVLVTSEGRAVLLDFGIVLDAGDTHRTLDSGVVGTPAYMSPEQAAGQVGDAPSDFYALGTMIYEALTGTVPFEGSYTEVLRRKQQEDVVPPSQLVSDVPPDLEELALRLLQRDPAARPGADEILQLLSAGTAAQRATAAPPAKRSDSVPPFVGREAEVAELRRALAGTDAGKPGVVLVTGPSGIGKTTLAARFLEEVAASGRSVVLRGRCYERESLPYKAIDSLVDALSRYLRRLLPLQVAELMPRDIVALAQVFPVLRRVEEISQAKRRGPLPADPQELRRRAGAALKELLVRLSDRRRLVLFIDDLQWGDVDSARLLVETMTGVEAPSALLLCAYRNDDAGSSPCLRAFLSQLRAGPDVDVRDVAVRALSADDSARLAGELLGAERAALARSVGSESQGSPFLVTELVRHAREQAPAAEPAPRVEVAEALQARLAALSMDARTLLQLVSVAGRPVPEETLALASSFNIDLQVALAELRAGKLVRGVALREARAVETYHDRIREAVVSRLGPELLAIWHRRLASTLEASGSPDLEAVVDHLLGAREHARAGLYALRAAAQAERALAFEKAARLYAIAHEHHAQTPADKRELLVRWADALVSAGRGSQAADLYFQAAQQARGVIASELRRKASVQLVLGGHVAEGIEIIKETLQELSAPLPADFAQSLAQLRTLHERLSARGLRIDPRAQATAKLEPLRSLDALWAVTLGLLIGEIDRPLPLIGRYLLQALDLGEPLRVLQGLCLYHAFIDATLQGSERMPPIGALAAAEELLRAQPGLPVSWLVLARGFALHFEGDVASALSELGRAEALFRASGPRGSTEVRLCRLLIAAIELGFMRVERLRTCAAWAQEAEERDDLVVATRLRVIASVRELLEGDPEGARQRCDLAAARFHGGAHDFTAIALWVVRTRIDLYLDDPRAARQRCDELSDFATSPAATVPLWRGRVGLLRACAALCAARVEAEPSPLLARAAADVEAVAAQRIAAFDCEVALLRAALSAAAGQWSSAAEQAQAALAATSAHTSPLLLATALLRSAELGGPDADGRRSAGLALMREHGVAEPDRLALVFAPRLLPPARD